METGIKAWLANQEHEATKADVRVELPKGWYWDMKPGGIGYLKNPNDMLCVGYDIDNQSIHFGNNGEVHAPGLNLWTVQEMGERFAREYCMTKEEAAAYDSFADQRDETRKTHERNMRSMMTGLVQLEVKNGEWTAHADCDKIKQLIGIELDPDKTLSGEEGVALFNRMSRRLCVMPLRDPLGYMTLNNNLYTYIKNQYVFQYEDTIDAIDAGFINGNGRGCEAVLDKIDSTVRKNMREFCLPEGVSYLDLRHTACTPELTSAVDAFVKQRVTKTVNFEKKRSHSAESLAKDHEKFLAAGDNLRMKIGEAVLSAFTLPVEVQNGMTLE